MKATWTKGSAIIENNRQKSNQRQKSKHRQKLEQPCRMVSPLRSHNGGIQIDYDFRNPMRTSASGTTNGHTSAKQKTNPRLKVQHSSNSEKSKIILKENRGICKNKGFHRSARNMPSKTAATQRTYAPTVMRRKTLI